MFSWYSFFLCRGNESDVDFDSDECGFSDDDNGSNDREKMFMDEETKSRFTNYSMSSSVIRRNEGLTLLDDRFEKVCDIQELIYTNKYFQQVKWTNISSFIYMIY